MLRTLDPEKFSKYFPIDTRDYKASLGFNLLMGINSLPSVDDYWRKNRVYHYDRIARDRYREISRYLDYMDNTNV
jgi:hypothetical protein